MQTPNQLRASCGSSAPARPAFSQGLPVVEMLVTRAALHGQHIARGEEEEEEERERERERRRACDAEYRAGRQ